MEAQRAVWVKLAMVQMSRLPPGPQFAGVQVDQEELAERRWGSEPEILLLFSSLPPFAAAKAV